MPRYPNGQIPEKVLVKFGTEHWTTPGTLARWKALVADVKKNEGVTLRITGGPNAYRNLRWQEFYWDTLPYPQAALPKTSSHGGAFRGKDTMALDVDNWSAIGKAKFYAYARKHGFEPGYFSWEPWHIIDWNPWVVPNTSGGNSKPVPKPVPKPTPAVPEEEEDDMPKNTGVTFLSPAGAARAQQREYALIHNTGSGFQMQVSSGLGGSLAQTYKNSLAKTYDTPSWTEVSEGVADVIKDALAQVRASK